MARIRERIVKGPRLPKEACGPNELAHPWSGRLGDIVLLAGC